MSLPKREGLTSSGYKTKTDTLMKGLRVQERTQRVRVAKKELVKSWGRRMVEHFRYKKGMFWKEVKRMRKVESVKKVKVKDEDGAILMEKNKVCLR